MNHGLVALGDSITRGKGGERMLGVHDQSWAQWVAEALVLPLTNLAVDGARAPEVLREQVPMLERPYDLGTLHVGVNDARDPAWDPDRFGEAFEGVLAALAAACEAVLVCTLPLDLGRPTAAPKPAAANAIVRAAAARAGARVVALDDLAGPIWILPDAVHATAAGQAEIARRALAVCGLPRRGPAPPVPDADPKARRRWRRRRLVLEFEDRARRRAEARGR